MFHREPPQAVPAVTAFPSEQNNDCNTLTGDSSALPVCIAAASPSQQNPQKFCKDCTTTEIVLSGPPSQGSAQLSIPKGLEIVGGGTPAYIRQRQEAAGSSWNM